MRESQMSESADFLRARPEYKNPTPGIMSQTKAVEAKIHATSPVVTQRLRSVVTVNVSSMSHDE